MAKPAGIVQIKSKQELGKRVKMTLNVTEETHKQMLMLNDLIATKIYPKRLCWSSFIELMVWKYQDSFIQDIIKDFASLEAVEIS